MVPEAPTLWQGRPMAAPTLNETHQALGEFFTEMGRVEIGMRAFALGDVLFKLLPS
jgi:hypothetical protein